mmetsp:Transcript_55209/g.123418  ORF Transcript_55209/g.123418 Transcript_55209/m.123418 type:complete len:88 (-) Transcript_55209:1517-1780(-)
MSRTLRRWNEMCENVGKDTQDLNNSRGAETPLSTSHTCVTSSTLLRASLRPNHLAPAPAPARILVLLLPLLPMWSQTKARPTQTRTI